MKNIRTRPFIPEKLEIEEIAPNHVKLHAYPFEPGYAVTVAHPMRRLLLSSTVGYAPIAIKIDGVAHEFDSVRGITEDVAPFIANIKNLKFKVKKEVSKQDRIEVSYEFAGPMDLKGGSLSNELIEIINEDYHLANINNEAKLAFSLIIQKGLGYVPSEAIREEMHSGGYIPLDAFFTPVRKAVYVIEKILQDGNPDYEKIVFEVETNGQVEPVEAFREAVVIMHHQMEIFGARITPIPPDGNGSDDPKELKDLLKSVETLSLEHRPSNCLQKAGIKYIGELVLMSDSDLKNIKNLGKKSFDEIATKMNELGYPIGMDLPNELAAQLQKRLTRLKGQN